MVLRIQQLSPAVANQIAAGEVIERPASVVKELLENALDAQADSIHIETGYGGLNQIKISDNGVGIVAADLPLALAAHATSKISRLQDLYAISSMGFRGEALASIASVARLTISSKPADQEHGMMLDNRQPSLLIPCARTQGTTVDVRDIFFNAPVRKKFLKTERCEFQAIDTVVRRFALGAPAIAIQLSHNGKVQLALPAAKDEASRKNRMARIFGKAFSEQSLYLAVQHAGLALSGWISTAAYQRSQNDRIWLYINARMVRDKLLNHAIKQAYEDILYPGRHPACLLYLTIDPGEVDVNVHPTKHEVRFQQPRLIHDFIVSRLRSVLQPVTGEDNSVYKPTPALFRPLQIREAPVHRPVLAQQPEKDSAGWCFLNERFAIVRPAEKPYLLDVIALQKKYLLSCLQSAEFPLGARPLLVPVYQEIPEGLTVSEHLIAELARLGIEVQVCKGSTLLLRSIPLMVPELDLKLFLQACLALKEPAMPQLLDLLVNSRTLDARYLSAEQRENLLDYLQAEAMTLPLSRHLSSELCQDLLDE